MNSSLSAARRWLEQLSEDVDQNHLTQARREEILGQLKFLGREAKVAEALYTEAGLKVFGHYAFGEYPRTTSREASRCIANALLLFPPTQKIFYELGFLPKAAEAFKSDDNLDEFVLGRILFLMTYSQINEFAVLIAEHDLVSTILAHVKRHEEMTPVVPKPNPDAIVAISETLKLIFNITNALPQFTSRFNPAVAHHLAVLPRIPYEIPPLQGALHYIINSLSNLEFIDESTGEPVSGISPHINLGLDRLLAILEQSLKSYTETQLDTQVVPLLTVLRKINEVADGDTRAKMQMRLLPKDAERDLPLGQSAFLASKLLKLTTSPGLEHLPEVVSSLLFELSGKDARTFVKNIGYGYAAGYLMTHKIPIPSNLQSTNSGEDQIPVNPVTGQRLDKEEDIELPPMSEEEKEREAERLFVLFERLRTTGVVDVKNPVHQAMEEGRFEEVEDSDEDSATTK